MGIKPGSDDFRSSCPVDIATQKLQKSISVLVAFE